MLKKCSSLLLALVLITVLFTGCRGNAKNENQTGDPGTSTTSATTATKTADTTVRPTNVGSRSYSKEKVVWGPGNIADHARPQEPERLQKQFGALGARFLLDNKKQLCLTFDEGYEFGLSGQILDTLKEKGVKAIFFITGDFAKAEPELVQRMGYLADRMSVNLELPTAEGLRTLAPNKHRKNILTPMRQIQNGIHANKEELILYRKSPHFVSGGQSTQMIIGATPETDYQILNVAENLYQKFELKRVFYSAFVKVNEDKSLPALPGGPPLLREHRLYQADWLLRFYGFKAEELLDERRPFFNVMLDPKEDWAVRHLECFPLEINRAPYADLLRVPGIGVKSARRILSARRSTKLTFQDLKKLGVVMKRAVYFITCGGRMMYPTKLEEDYIVRNLTDPKDRIRFGSDGMSYRQMTLFDDGMFPNGVRQEEKRII